MSSKALLLLTVFVTIMAVIQAGSVNVPTCDGACAPLGGGDITKCCNENKYKRGHCAGIPLISQRGWCDDHY